jgi:hypothetical protein
VIVILVLTFLLLEREGLSESKRSPLAVRKLFSIERSGVVLERDIKGVESGWTQPQQGGGRRESCLVYGRFLKLAVDCRLIGPANIEHCSSNFVRVRFRESGDGS